MRQKPEKNWVVVQHNNGKIEAWRDYGSAWVAHVYRILGYYTGPHYMAIKAVIAQGRAMKIAKLIHNNGNDRNKLILKKHQLFQEKNFALNGRRYPQTKCELKGLATVDWVVFHKCGTCTIGKLRKDGKRWMAFHFVISGTSYHRLVPDGEVPARVNEHRALPEPTQKEMLDWAARRYLDAGFKRLTRRGQ